MDGFQKLLWHSVGPKTFTSTHTDAAHRGRRGKRTHLTEQTPSCPKILNAASPCAQHFTSSLFQKRGLASFSSVPVLFLALYSQISEHPMPKNAPTLHLVRHTRHFLRSSCVGSLPVRPASRDAPATRREASVRHATRKAAEPVSVGDTEPVGPGDGGLRWDRTELQARKWDRTPIPKNQVI